MSQNSRPANSLIRTRKVLVTGGAGFIGSHTAKALAARDWLPVVFDNLSNGRRDAVKWGPFVHGDVRDQAALSAAMREHQVEAVIHFAGLIEVGRSMVRPDLFYDHNVQGTCALLSAMRDRKVGRLVFSSSAAVYGAPDGVDPLAPLGEGAPKAPSSPYGHSKLIGEQMIADYCSAFGLSGIALRYFNAAGADPDGEIGECHEPETHLIPLAIDAALGRGKPLTVFGRDFPTPDGSCIRDYVHVVDLAAAHVAALEATLAAGDFEALNVGVGEGYSVLQVVAEVERSLGRRTFSLVGARRGGDPACLVADSRLIRERLGWVPAHSTLPNIVQTAAAWRKRQGSPMGDQAEDDDRDETAAPKAATGSTGD